MFKGLERELIALTNVIDINSDHLNVYSTKIADLLNRTVTEIETLSKKLFFDNGGVWEKSGKGFKFDTVCLEFLNDNWGLENRKVYIASPYMHLAPDESEILPLLGAHKMHVGEWKNASNAVKHDRAKCLSEGTLRRFIDALAALFVLNLYNNDTVVKLGNTADGFDPSMGSEVFAIKKHPFPGIDADNKYRIDEDYDECTYLVRATGDTAAKAAEAIAEMNGMIVDEVMKLAVAKVNEELKSGVIPEEEIVQRIQQYIPILKGQAIAATAKKARKEIASAFVAVKYEAVLNKNQYKDQTVRLSKTSN